MCTCIYTYIGSCPFRTPEKDARNLLCSHVFNTMVAMQLSVTFARWTGLNAIEVLVPLTPLPNWFHDDTLSVQTSALHVDSYMIEARHVSSQSKALFVEAWIDLAPMSSAYAYYAVRNFDDGMGIVDRVSTYAVGLYLDSDVTVALSAHPSQKIAICTARRLKVDLKGDPADFQTIGCNVFRHNGTRMDEDDLLMTQNTETGFIGSADEYSHPTAAFVQQVESVEREFLLVLWVSDNALVDAYMRYVDVSDDPLLSTAFERMRTTTILFLGIDNESPRWSQLTMLRGGSMLFTTHTNIAGVEWITARRFEVKVGQPTGMTALRALAYNTTAYTFSVVHGYAYGIAYAALSRPNVLAIDLYNVADDLLSTIDVNEDNLANVDRVYDIHVQAYGRNDENGGIGVTARGTEVAGLVITWQEKLNCLGVGEHTRAMVRVLMLRDILPRSFVVPYGLEHSITYGVAHRGFDKNPFYDDLSWYGSQLKARVAPIAGTNGHLVAAGWIAVRSEVLYSATLELNFDAQRKSVRLAAETSVRLVPNGVVKYMVVPFPLENMYGVVMFFPELVSGNKFVISLLRSGFKGSPSGESHAGDEMVAHNVPVTLATSDLLQFDYALVVLHGLRAVRDWPASVETASPVLVTPALSSYVHPFTFFAVHQGLIVTAPVCFIFVTNPSLLNDLETWIQSPPFFVNSCSEIAVARIDVTTGLWYMMDENAEFFERDAERLLEDVAPHACVAFRDTTKASSIPYRFMGMTVRLQVIYVFYAHSATSAAQIDTVGGLQLATGFGGRVAAVWEEIDQQGVHTVAFVVHDSLDPPLLSVEAQVVSGGYLFDTEPVVVGLGADCGGSFLVFWLCTSCENTSLIGLPYSALGNGVKMRGYFADGVPWPAWSEVIVNQNPFGNLRQLRVTVTFNETSLGTSYMRESGIYPNVTYEWEHLDKTEVMRTTEWVAVTWHDEAEHDGSGKGVHVRHFEGNFLRTQYNFAKQQRLTTTSELASASQGGTITEVPSGSSSAETSATSADQSSIIEMTASMSSKQTTVMPVMISTSTPSDSSGGIGLLWIAFVIVGALLLGACIGIAYLAMRSRRVRSSSSKTSVEHSHVDRPADRLSRRHGGSRRHSTMGTAIELKRRSRYLSAGAGGGTSGSGGGALSSRRSGMSRRSRTYDVVSNLSNYGKMPTIGSSDAGGSSKGKPNVYGAIGMPSVDTSGSSVYAGTGFAAFAELAYQRLVISDVEVNRAKIVGEGFSGIVWRGTWRGNDVAIKDVHVAGVRDRADHGNDGGGADGGGGADASLSAAERRARDAFLKEAAAMQSIEAHPNVLPLLAVVVTPSVALVTPFCERGSLESHLYGDDAYRLWPVVRAADARRWLCDISRALAHLHANAIVHRDVAARNILVAADDRLLMTDFGMSRRVGKLSSDAAAGKTKQRLGPVKWMAPEQLRDGVYSAASDVWSMAMVALEISSREAPWRNVSNVEAAAQIMEGQLPVMSRALGAAARALLLRCFSEEAKDRPGADEVEREFSSMSDSDVLCMDVRCGSDLFTSMDAESAAGDASAKGGAGGGAGAYHNLAGSYEEPAGLGASFNIYDEPS